MCALAAPSQQLAAQSPAATAPVKAGQEWRLTLLDTLPSGAYVYQYQLDVDSLLHPRGVAQVRFDLTTPRMRFAPGLTGVRGVFLFDALRRQHEEAVVSHPPVFVGMPRNWVGFIDREGFMTWRSDRPGPTPTTVGHYFGREPAVVGFVLQSEAVPAIRPWYAEELVFDLSDPEARTSRRAPPRMTRTAGYQIGPGWMPDQITAAWTAEQIRLLCGVGLIPDCAAWEPVRVGLRKPDRPSTLAAAQQGRALVLGPAGKTLAPIVRLLLIKHLSLVIAPQTAARP